MSSTPTLEHRSLAIAADWVDVVPPRHNSRLSSSNIMVAIAAIRAAASTDEGIVIDTDDFRVVDSGDIEAAALADQRWDS